MREEDEAYVRELIAAELARERIEQQKGQVSELDGLVRSLADIKNDPNKKATTEQNDDDRGDEHDELKGIREWIDSLPDDGVELLRCMEFDILCPISSDADGGSGGSGVGGNDPGAAAATSTDPGSDVLLQLLQTQAPPPTPIHPRAVSYKSASCAIWGATDGRDEGERVLKERFRRPRLFQLVASAGGRKKAGSGRPIAQRNGRGKRPQQSQMQSHNNSGMRYDAIARKFITSSGDVLSIGCTDRQRAADELFLSETMVTYCFDDIGVGTDAAAAVQGMRRRCHLRLSRELSLAFVEDEIRSRKESIMRILSIVSRGRFLSAARSKGAGPDTSCPFCAPWLDPTSEWFSLPTFLASRFEVALWDAFERWKSKGSALTPACSSPLDNFLSAYSDADANRLLGIAVAAAFSKLLSREDTRSGLVRDGHVWRLINAIDFVRPSNANGQVTCKSLLSLPLIQMGSSADEYRSFVLRCLRDYLAVEAEKNLLSEMAGEEEKKTDGNSNASAVTAARSKRSKKKRKKGRKSRGLPMLKSIDEASPTHEEIWVNNNNNAADAAAALDDDDAILRARGAHSPSLPSVGANQNTIMVLQILDGILRGVFDQVGLGGGKEGDPDRAFVSVGEKKEAKPQKQSISFQYKRPRKGPAAGTAASSAPSVDPSGPPRNAPEIAGRWNQASSETAFAGSRPYDRPQSPPEDSSSISMLSYNTNPYHQPQSPHEHVFSFMDSSQSNLSNRPTTGGFHGYGSIFDDGASPLGMALNLGSNGGHGFNESGAFGSSWSGRLGRHYPSRNRSLFTDFFDSEDAREAQDIDELLAASTAASIASSNPYDDASSSNAAYDDDSETAGNVYEEGYEDIRESDRSPANLSAVVEDANTGNEIDRQMNSSSRDMDNGQDSQGRTENGPSVKVPGDGLGHDDSDSGHMQKVRVEAGASTEENDIAERTPSPLPSPSLLPHPDPPTPTPEDPQRVTTPSQNNTSGLQEHPLTPSEAPPTPPPQLSPIQVSLADLGKFIKASKRSGDLSREFEKATSISSLPGSPRLDSTKRNWSRDDLTRLASMNDDTASSIRARRRRVRSSSSHNFEEVMSYRTALSKSIKGPSNRSYEVRSVAGSADHRFLDRRKLLRPRLSIPDMKNATEVPIVDGPLHSNLCARSETALDGYEDSSHVNVMRPHDEIDNATATRDGATTISSAASPGEPQEVSHLREERDAFRDLCLTLGAEVAKLKSTVAALQQGQNSMVYAHPQMDYNTASYVPSMPMPQPYFYPTNAPNLTTTQGFPPGYAMSDAGIANETTRSEDGSDAIHQGDGSGLQTQLQGGQGHPTGFIQIRRPSLSCNRTVSNASVDHDGGCHGSIAMSALRSSVHRDASVGGVLSQGLQSRLSVDINSYCASISSQLKKQESRRITATKRLTRLVTALWPRAQVKLYGSHVTDLCLPSSDLDFVICLPSVHNVEIATTPGVLEGRNAINETNQKVLARKLKGESWIDPRSIKVIERTAIPVIKVSTKDKRSRVIQLDISFDGPNHHGLEAIDLVTETIQEYPVCRPLMLVLKQFLLDRGLLTAYTGGLSSYGLFLMLSRYLQEQTIGSWSDCGSLLVGFLDFWGNHFDPRQTGISVRNRQFFSRPYYSQQTQHFDSQPMWNAPQPVVSQMTGEGSEFPDLSRRHSFAETVPRNIIGVKGTVVPGGVPASSNIAPSTTMKSPVKYNPSKPPRIQTKRSMSQLSLHNEYPVTSHSPKVSEPLPHRHQAQFPPSSPTVPSNQTPVYTFDPLMCEDPLNQTNNIGRNTFRIFQVLRAFSDAHRALVASLEWDMNMNDENDFPLLKSLLQNEDVFFESESHLSLQPN